MDDPVWRDLLDEAASDPGARSARRELCRVLVTAFEEMGRLLRVIGHVSGLGRVDGSSPFGNGDDRLVAMGYLSATAGSLLAGMSALFDDENLYAGAALSRQLVEVEYLMWAFAGDQEEASSWLRSTPDERRARWQPRHLRSRSRERFPGSDYGEHCEFGGHPTPKGVRALIDTRPIIKEVLLDDAARHGVSIWEYAVAAVRGSEVLDPDRGVPRQQVEAVAAAAASWRSCDRIGGITAVWRARPSP